MSLFAKIMVVVNFVLAVAFLAAAGTLLGAAEDYKAKYTERDAAATREKEQLTAQVAAMQAEVDKQKSLRSDAEKTGSASSASLKQLQESNVAVQTANTQLRSELQKLADAQKDLQQKLADLNTQLDKARAELNTSETERKAAMEQARQRSEEIARLTQEKETAEKNLEANRVEANTLREQLDAATTLNERYKKEFPALPGGVSMTKVDGKVSAVDNKVDIYVLSVGKKDGVQVGYEFTVYRGSEYVSTIVIDKVFDNYSSGSTKPGTKKKDVMPGDEASTRL